MSSPTTSLPTRRRLERQVLARQELDRRACKADPVRFLDRHIQIEEPDGTVIPLELWPFQADVIRALHSDRAIVVLKARRLGLSWIVLAYALWLAIFQQGVRILVLCKKEDDAIDLVDRVRRMRDRIAGSLSDVHVLNGLQPPPKIRDAVTVLDVGASTIKALVGTPDAARSETAGLVILDEFAFQRGASEIWRAAYPTIEGGGRLAVVSTGNGGPESGGKGAEFARQWTDANTGQSDLKAFFHPWTARPDRDEAWKARTIAALGDEERFRIEYPEVPAHAFLAPDVELVFDTTAIDAAVRLGARLDEQLTAGTIAPPDGEAIKLGIDWGEHTTGAEIGWPLERGGLYVPPGELELHAAAAEPGRATQRMLDVAAGYDVPLDEARYDAAGAQSMRTFAAQSPETIGIWKVAFSKHKSETVGYLRQLLNRTRAGESTRVLAVSPRNTTLIRQLRTREFNARGDLVKGDDHNFDALIALTAPIAERHRQSLQEATD